MLGRRSWRPGRAWLRTRNRRPLKIGSRGNERRRALANRAGKPRLALFLSLSRPLPEPLRAIVTFIAASLRGSDAQESLGPTQAALGNIFDFGAPENFGGWERTVVEGPFEPRSGVAGPQLALTSRHSLLQEAALRPPGLFRFGRRSCSLRPRRSCRRGVCPFALRRPPTKHNLRHKTSPCENF